MRHKTERSEEEEEEVRPCPASRKFLRFFDRSHKQTNNNNVMQDKRGRPYPFAWGHLKRGAEGNGEPSHPPSIQLVPCSNARTRCLRTQFLTLETRASSFPPLATVGYGYTHQNPVDDEKKRKKGRYDDGVLRSKENAG